MNAKAYLFSTHLHTDLLLLNAILHTNIFVNLQSELTIKHTIFYG